LIRVVSSTEIRPFTISAEIKWVVRLRSSLVRAWQVGHRGSQHAMARAIASRTVMKLSWK
jgi:hypothetical protein